MWPKDCNLIHGESIPKSIEYEAWAGMLKRCYNPMAWNYKYYGERGIYVCARWHKYKAFLKDVGRRPEGKTLDRINVDGWYKPSNFRWATNVQQRQNRRGK